MLHNKNEALNRKIKEAEEKLGAERNFMRQETSYIKEVPYKIVHHTNGNAWAEARGQKYSPSQVGCFVLNKVKETAESFLDELGNNTLQLTQPDIVASPNIKMELESMPGESCPRLGDGPIIEQLTLSGAEVRVGELNMLGRTTKSLTHMQGKIKEGAITDLGQGRGAPATPSIQTQGASKSQLVFRNSSSCIHSCDILFSITPTQNHESKRHLIPEQAACVATSSIWRLLPRQSNEQQQGPAGPSY
ncbi:hypothetical protein DL767_011337 [Monosporascus sp. MG133]|nr:hypothetical protein DL767_011337 [Monosporascus sp. MG133]